MMSPMNVSSMRAARVGASGGGGAASAGVASGTSARGSTGRGVEGGLASSRAVHAAHAKRTSRRQLTSWTLADHAGELCYDALRSSSRVAKSMRVGEILIVNGWVDGPSLQRAIAEQRHTGKRLCSLLIGRGLLDSDHASRALGEQHGVAAVLQRHLEHRDRALAV